MELVILSVLNEADDVDRDFSQLLVRSLIRTFRLELSLGEKSAGS